MRWRLPGKQAVGNDVRFQATITKTARECILTGGEITARIGIQGRVIAGRPGAPPTVEIPMRVAVVQGGVGEKVIATKAYRTTVTMTEDGSVPFTLVADDLVYPVPPAAVADNYVFYIGFDPQALAPEPKAERQEEEVGRPVMRSRIIAKRAGFTKTGANDRSRRPRFAEIGELQFSFCRTSAMPLVSRSSATRP